MITKEHAMLAQLANRSVSTLYAVQHLGWRRTPRRDGVQPLILAGGKHHDLLLTTTIIPQQPSPVTSQPISRRGILNSTSA
ncbi:hypothetical protein PSPO01_13665 [Paraphaeosphaeria sporulosa]